MIFFFYVLHKHSNLPLTSQQPQAGLKSHSFPELLQIRNTSYRTSLGAKLKLPKHIFNLKIFLRCYFFFMEEWSITEKLSFTYSTNSRYSLEGCLEILGMHHHFKILKNISPRTGSSEPFIILWCNSCALHTVR